MKSPSCPYLLKTRFVKNTFYLLVIVVLSLLIGFFWGSRSEELGLFSAERSSAQAKMNLLMDYVDQRYVDSLDIDALSIEVIQEIIDRLDPHTVYIPKEESQALSETMQGNFVGIGVSFYMVQDTVTIVRVLGGGPSKKAGILAGDRILIADTDTLYQKEFQIEDIVSKLKGTPDSSVNLQFYRPQNDSLFSLTMPRGTVPLKSVEAHFPVNETTGYIKINRFSQTTYEEFITALRSFDLYQTKKLILDLRDNPGGYMFPAKQIADEFLEDGNPIVITKSNNGIRQQTLATEKGGYEKGEVYVLLNEQSASAAEVLAGALQDNDRAWIVGRRSFGKGLVQQQLPLGDGDAVRLTTARYYTPTGRSIQRPYSSDKEAYYDEVNQRYDSGEMADVAKVPVNDTLVYKTPGGRTVYGGGGITPDIYVPNNNTRAEEFDFFLLRSNLMNHFVFSTIDEDRGAYEFASEADFIATPLANTQRWIQDFKTYCKDNGLPLNIKDTQIVGNAIKAYLGLQLFGENCYAKILTQQDVFIERALTHRSIED